MRLLVLFLFFGLSGYCQQLDSLLFRQRLELLESQLNNHYSSDLDTVALRDEALAYMVDITEIKPHPWVNFAFIIPYSRADVEKWKDWAIQRGIRHSSSPTDE